FLLAGATLFVKAFLLVALGAFLRAVYPRFRIDQAISIGWKIAFPLSLISVVISLSLIMGGVSLVIK
ncbi:MAG: NADH-quinone oxidoreductase subunit H, partial [Candidatus Korarchaeum sp.]